MYQSVKILPMVPHSDRIWSHLRYFRIAIFFSLWSHMTTFGLSDQRGFQFHNILMPDARQKMEAMYTVQSWEEMKMIPWDMQFHKKEKR